MPHDGRNKRFIIDWTEPYNTRITKSPDVHGENGKYIYTHTICTSGLTFACSIGYQSCAVPNNFHRQSTNLVIDIPTAVFQ